MKTDITTTGFELGAELKKYSKHKIAEVTRRVPLKVRPDSTYAVQFVQKRKKGEDIKTCSLTLTLPDASFHSQETTQHMYSALDIATASIRQQLHEYVVERRREAIRARLNRGSAIDE